MRKLSPADFAERIQPLVSERFPGAARDHNFSKKAALIQERVTYFHEAPAMLRFFYEEPEVSMDLLANTKQKVTTKLLPRILKLLLKSLESVLDDEWTGDSLKMKVQELMEREGLSQGQLLWPLRAALTGLPFSPGAYEVAVALGRDTTLTRLEAALAILA
jgi:glutamyl-tRNA synthetase